MNATNPDSWFHRCRLAFIERHAKHVGHIRRSDVMEAFGISPAQASSDFQVYLSMNPGAFVYSTARKRYEWVKRSAIVINPAPWETLFPAAKPVARPCRRCGGMGWVPSRHDTDTDPCPECSLPPFG